MTPKRVGSAQNGSCPATPSRCRSIPDHPGSAQRRTEVHPTCVPQEGPGRLYRPGLLALLPVGDRLSHFTQTLAIPIDIGENGQ